MKTIQPTDSGAHAPKGEVVYKLCIHQPRRGWFVAHTGSNAACMDYAMTHHSHDGVVEPMAILLPCDARKAYGI